MSKKYLFSCLDAAAGIFSPPSAITHIGAAIRSFTDQVNDPNTGELYRHPSDFALYEVGTFDDTTGIITPLSLPKLTIQGASCKNPTMETNYDMARNKLGHNNDIAE